MSEEQEKPDPKTFKFTVTEAILSLRYDETAKLIGPYWVRFPFVETAGKDLGSWFNTPVPSGTAYGTVDEHVERYRKYLEGVAAYFCDPNRTEGPRPPRPEYLPYATDAEVAAMKVATEDLGEDQAGQLRRAIAAEIASECYSDNHVQVLDRRAEDRATISTMVEFAGRLSADAAYELGRLKKGVLAADSYAQVREIGERI